MNKVLVALVLMLSANAFVMMGAAQEKTAIDAEEMVDGVPWSAADDALWNAHATCERHPNEAEKAPDGTLKLKNPDFWPHPCSEAEKAWKNSGAAERHEEIKRRDRQEQLDMVHKAIGK